MTCDLHCYTIKVSRGFFKILGTCQYKSLVDVILKSNNVWKIKLARKMYVLNVNCS